MSPTSQRSSGGGGSDTKKIKAAVAVGLLVVAVGFVAWRLMGLNAGPAVTPQVQQAEQRAQELVNSAPKQPEDSQAPPPPPAEPPTRGARQAPK